MDTSSRKNQILMGIEALHGQQYSQAIDYLSSGLEGYPSNSLYLAHLGWAFYFSGDYLNAHERFSQAVGIDSKLDYALRGRGWVHYQEGRHDEALDDFQLVLERLDRSQQEKDTLQELLRGIGWSCYHLGCRNKDLGRIDQAITELTKALQAPSSDSDVVGQEIHRALGWCFQKRGNFADAIEHFDKALAMISEDQKEMLGDAQRGRNLAEELLKLKTTGTFIDSIQDPELFTSTPLTELDLPEYIEIEPTYTCNLRCIQCHVSYQELSKENLDLKFLDHMKGLEGKWVVLGSNYEPMAHPQFGEMVQGLSDLKLNIDLTTNGTLFSQRMINTIKGANFRNIVISFDGHKKETYEKIRRNADYDQALERILNFRKAVSGPEAYFALNYTVLQSNIDEITDSVKFWDQAGFDHMGVIVMVARYDQEILHLESPESEMDRFYKEIEKAANFIVGNDKRITLSSAGLNREFELKSENPELFVKGCVRSRHPEAKTPFNAREFFQNGPFPGMKVNCRSPFKFARILHNGDVQLCYQFVVGNIYEKPFLDIWYGKNSERVRNHIKDKEKVCWSCDYYNLCIRAGEVDYGRVESFYSDRVLGDTKKLQPIGRYKGYRILSWLNDYYGIPLQLGPYINALNLLSAEEFSDVGVVSASTVKELKGLIEIRLNDDFSDLLCNPKISEFFTGMNEPSYVEMLYDYNIVALKGKYYGVPQHLGMVDVNSDVTALESQTGVFHGYRYQEIRQSIMELRSPFFLESSKNKPILVGCYQNYNIVLWREIFFGIPHEAGQVDLMEEIEKLKAMEGIIARTKFEEVFSEILSVLESSDDQRKMIDQQPEGGPERIAAYKGYHILKWRGLYYAIPLGSGEINPLHMEFPLSFPESGILTSKGEGEIKGLIDSKPFNLRRMVLRALVFLRNLMKPAS